MVKTTSPAQNGQRSASSGNTRIPDALRKTSSSSTHAVSPTNLNSTAIPSNNSVPYQAPANGLSGNRNDGLAGLFDPAILEYASRSNSADYMSHPSGETVSTNGTVKKDSFASTNSQSQVPNVRHASTTSFTGSPVSLMSQALDSSCGTTPESSAESPDNRKGSDGVMNTFNEKANGQNMTGGKTSFEDKLAKYRNLFLLSIVTLTVIQLLRNWSNHQLRIFMVLTGWLSRMVDNSIQCSSEIIGIRRITSSTALAIISTTHFH